MQRTFSPASVEYLPTGELIPYPRNARTHSKKADQGDRPIDRTLRLHEPGARHERE